MREFLLFIGFFVAMNAYSLVYEKNQNGVPEFSNIKFKGDKQVNLENDPVSVIDMDNIPKKIVWGNMRYQDSNSSNIKRGLDTLQSSFPEQFTDNYYDFYGRNHDYNSLMSSTIGMSMYSRGDANNMRLQSNY